MTSKQTDPLLQIISPPLLLSHIRFINVWVENLVVEADGRRFEGVLGRQFYRELPVPVLVRCYSAALPLLNPPTHTLFWSVKVHVELLHAVLDQTHLIVAHQPVGSD